MPELECCFGKGSSGRASDVEKVIKNFLIISYHIGKEIVLKRFLGGSFILLPVLTRKYCTSVFVFIIRETSTDEN